MNDAMRENDMSGEWELLLRDRAAALTELADRFETIIAWEENR